MKRIATCAALAVAAMACGASGQNLMSNGSFEDFSPFGGGFTDWPVLFGNASQDTSVDVPAFDGISSLKMFGGFFSPCAQSDAGMIQDVPVPGAGGKTFQLSVMVYTPSTDAITPLDETTNPNDCPDTGPQNFGHVPVLLMDFKNAAGDVLMNVTDDQFLRAGFPVTDEWIMWSIEGVAPAGTEQIAAFPLLVQFGFAGGAIFWDDMQLMEVESGPMPCNIADVSLDLGVLNVNDIVTFVNAFNGADLNIADVSPMGGDGVLNVNDIVEFVNAFNAGCP